MDFRTIKNRMEAKDGTGYKNVREIYADVRLVFKNAMKYNDERNDVHVMAQTLLKKFEEKWLQLLPKVVEEVHCYLNLNIFFFARHCLILCQDCYPCLSTFFTPGIA